jgi:hypothetical protein
MTESRYCSPTRSTFEAFSARARETTRPNLETVDVLCISVTANETQKFVKAVIDVAVLMILSVHFCFICHDYVRMHISGFM